MSTIRTGVAALAVAAAVILPATGAVAAESGSQARTDSRADAPPAAQSGDLVTAPAVQTRASILDLVNSFMHCEDALDTSMYPTSPFFVFDCMRGAPASNG